MHNPVSSLGHRVVRPATTLTLASPTVRACPMLRACKTRDVSLAPELDAPIDGRTGTGRYRSASEVVRAALHLRTDEPRRNVSRAAEPDAAGQSRREGPACGG